MKLGEYVNRDYLQKLYPSAFWNKKWIQRTRLILSKVSNYVTHIIRASSHI